MIGGSTAEAQLREKLHKIEALFAGAALPVKKLQLMRPPSAFVLVCGLRPVKRKWKRSSFPSQTSGPASSLSRYVVDTASTLFDIAGCTGKPLSSKHRAVLSNRFCGQSFRN
jgi:hypothetical protein